MHFKVAMSCHVMPWHVKSSHVLSCHVMSCHVMSYHVMSYHVMLCHVMSFHVMSCHVKWCCAKSCHVVSCHVKWCCAKSCHVVSCHVMSYPVVLNRVISCHISGGSKTYQLYHYTLVKLRKQFLNDNLLLIYYNKIYNRSKLCRPNTKNGWTKKIDGPMNWVGQTMNWVGQCPAGPPIESPLCHVLSHLLFCHALSCLPSLSFCICHIMSYYVMSLSYHVISCHVIL